MEDRAKTKGQLIAELRRLRESEHLLRQLGDGITEVFWVGSRDWSEVHYVSHAYETVWGRSCSSLVEKPMSWVDAVIEEDRPSVVAAINVRATGDLSVPDFPEYRIVRPDGTQRWIHARSFPVPDTQGEVSRIVGIARDITARKQAEERLRQANERFTHAFTYSGVGMALVDVAGRFISVNPAVRQILGYSEEEMLAKTFRDIAHPQDLPDCVAQYESLLRGECAHYELEKRYIHRDGHTIWGHLSVSRLREEDGTPAASVAHLRDITEHHHARRALAESEERHRLLMQHAGVGIGYFSPDGKLLALNDLGGAAMGGRAEDSIGKTLVEMFGEEAGREYEIRVGEAVKTGTSRNYEDTVPLPTGSRTLISAYAPICNDEGRTLGVQIICQDISDRKRMEQQLAMSEERFRLILEKAPVMINAFDSDGRFTIWNLECERVFGWTLEDLQNADDPLSLFYPDSNDRDEAVESITSKTSGVHREWHPKTKDGREITALWKKLELPAGSTVSFGQDITERKEADRRLQASEQRFRAVFEQAGDSLMVLDPNTQDGIPVIVDANDAACRAHGYTREEFIGRPIVDIDDEDGKRLCAERAKLIMSGKPLRVENTHVRSDGTTFPVSIRADRVGIEGEPPLIFSTERDITELRQLEERLRQTEKMDAIGQLAGGVAHDFNNMLEVIIGYTELTLGDQALAPSLHADLQEVLKAARRSADLTRQLLTFARKQVISPRILDLNETVGGMLKMLRRLIGENIELDWQTSGGLWPIMMDPSQVDQILANLCVNARDAIGGVGAVKIALRNVVLDEASCIDHAVPAPGEYVLLSVSDDGCGMNQGTLDQVFEPFFTTKEIGKGTGLGLAAVYGIVQQNAGGASIRSEPGLGTTFEIYLPRHVGAASVVTDGGGAVLRGTETVLVVEDEPSILKMAKKMLGKRGYSVLTAATPGEATGLVMARTGDIHLLITDVIMPEMNGQDLATSLLQLRPGLKCLFMSGYPADVIAQHGVLEEGVWFIQKPFSSKELGTKVREVLEQS